MKTGRRALVRACCRRWNRSGPDAEAVLFRPTRRHPGPQGGQRSDAVGLEGRLSGRAAPLALRVPTAAAKEARGYSRVTVPASPARWPTPGDSTRMLTTLAPSPGAMGM